jgi:hypothetical protein
MASAQGEGLAAAAVGQQSEVSDLDEACGQHVEQEAADAPVSPQPDKRTRTAPVTSVAAKPEFKHLFTRSTPYAPVAPRPAQPALAIAPQRGVVPGRYLTLEKLPISAFDDNPVFNEIGAAKIVGVSAEVLKKWRQRNMGPDYIQYGAAGPVRYEFNALMEFRATHVVKPGRKL